MKITIAIRRRPGDADQVSGGRRTPSIAKAAHVRGTRSMGRADESGMVGMQR